MASCSLPLAANSFTKMILPLESRKSSSAAIRSSSVPYPTPQCKELPDQICNNRQTILRRSANFKPSIWTYEYIQSLSSEYKDTKYLEQGRVLREEVRKMLGRVENQLDQLELIDVLQRLGISYHFSNEIKKILDNIYNMDAFKKKKNLYATALEFRLLRQHGYDISTDVFVCFQDEMGNFKKNPSIDVEEMLSLYEASFHLMEEESILDEARDFTTQYLKEYLNHNKGDHISLLIGHALELPLHWRIPRWEAQWFIDAYERKQNMSLVLLQLAKLDFNSVQAIYQHELKHTSRWWKRTGLGEKLSFSRDRLVESFIWTVGTNFKPDVGYFRSVMTKINSLVTTIDDVYDVYGTLDELELFTEAVDRWDLNAMDNLPGYMKICFYALYNFVNDTAFETLKNTGYYIAPYLKKSWTDLCKSYFIEAKWYHRRSTPSFQEYIENALVSISAPVVLVHAYFSIPHSFNKEHVVYLEEYSEIIRSSAVIARLANDLASYKRENETGDVPKSIQCYMNECGASEGEAREYVKSMMCTMWKRMNKEACNSSLSPSFIETAMNLARMALCIYQHGDGHTVQDLEIRNRILSLIIQPIPTICYNF
ncbi:terpene synthase 10-like [Abrus precatorius]|uniref:Terpene synthase 10-like n=1 Tax=Abrus precatorius TaxID=3816 RepID=A0A8B8KGR6_ABRPR|nr:terpene synthase 10-like [Abrus precatorius]